MCSRCGADLEPLMILAARAWLSRQEARRALVTGHVPSARRLASAAEELHATPGGAALVLLTAWLSGGQSSGG